MLRAFPTAAVAAALLAAALLSGADTDRDFTGQWILDPPSAAARAMRPAPPESLSVHQTAQVVECTSPAGHWTYALDGSDWKDQVGGETWNNAVKWEGAALLINTLVSGPENYTVMDRWELSRNGAQLKVTRQVARGGGVSEAQFYYRRQGAAAEPTLPAAPTASSGLVRRPDPATTPEPVAAAEFVVPSGTHVLLELVNRLDTKHSKEGDRVYLRTAFPVYATNHLVIPQGATVLGTVTQAKPAGKTKGELYIRFDSLTLPNGVTRDFVSHLGSANGAQGDVDRAEGKITSPSNKGEQTEGAIRGGGMGAGIGGIAGAAAGHAVTGLGVGGAVGAAAGLAQVLAKGKPEAVLPKGSNVEMVLDRDLRYRPDELR
jgi:type IV secretion system protein VirB10